MPAEPPPARLFGKVGAVRGIEVELAGEASIGRHPDNAVVVARPEVSGRHARIAWDPAAGGYYLEDLGSRNATVLDGLPVSGRERLGRLHVITLAGHDLIYHGPELAAAARKPAPRAAAGPPAPDTGLEGTMVEQAPPALPGALGKVAADKPGHTLIEHETPPPPATFGVQESGEADEDTVPRRTLVEGELPPLLPTFADASPERPAAAPQAPAERAQPSGSKQPAESTPTPPALALRLLNFGRVRDLPLVEGDNRIGRGTDVEVQIASADVSRLHAVVTVAGGRATLRDAGSRNHTYLAGEPLAAGAEAELEPGAALRFGTVEAELVAGGEPAGERAGD
jgi:pSer/pThr/pTyr-binding forkhead associated (FHA) protein